MDTLEYAAYGAAVVMFGLAVRAHLRRVRFTRELAARFAEHVAEQRAASVAVPTVDTTAQLVADRLEDERIAAFERRRGAAS